MGRSLRSLLRQGANEAACLVNAIKAEQAAARLGDAGQAMLAQLGAAE